MEITSHDAKIALCYPNSNSDLPVRLSAACPLIWRDGHESMWMVAVTILFPPSRFYFYFCFRFPAKMDTNRNELSRASQYYTSVSYSHSTRGNSTNLDSKPTNRRQTRSQFPSRKSVSPRPSSFHTVTKTT